MVDRVDIVDLDSAAEVSVSSARVVIDKRLLLSFYMRSLRRLIRSSVLF